MKFTQSAITFVALVTLSLCVAATGKEVDETKPASAQGYVGISVVRGTVKVYGWDENSVRVVGTLDDKTREYNFEVRDEETIIRVKIPENNRSGWFNDDGSDLAVYLPRSSRINIAGVSTNVEVRSTLESLDIGLVSGNVRLEEAMGRISVKTVSGNVNLRDSHGRLRIKTVSGDVESVSTSGDSDYTSISGDIIVDNGGQDLTLESVSGDIEVNNKKINNASGHSISGDVTLSGDASELGLIEFDSVSGSVRLRLEGNLNARFGLESGSGTIRNRLSDDKPKESRFLGDQTLRFTLGEGRGQVNLSTRSGDIALSR